MDVAELVRSRGIVEKRLGSNCITSSGSDRTMRLHLNSSKDVKRDDLGCVAIVAHGVQIPKRTGSGFAVCNPLRVFSWHGCRGRKVARATDTGMGCSDGALRYHSRLGGRCDQFRDAAFQTGTGCHDLGLGQTLFPKG